MSAPRPERSIRRPLRVNIAAIVLLALTALGCDRCGDALNRVNTPAFERYASTLQSHAGTSLKLERCERFGATRNGYCLLRGRPAEVTAFIKVLPVTPESPKEVFRDSCASLPSFGTPRPASASHVPRPGVQFFVPSGPLPPNTENVTFTGAAVDGAGERVCLELQIPYG